MTPTGERGFRSAADAKAAAQSHPGVTSFAVLQNAPRAFMQPEFGWVAPIEVFMSRMPQAMHAGIQVVELVAAK